MSDKKELKEEVLDAVNGGIAAHNGIDTNGQFSEFVEMDDLVSGQNYYFVLKTLKANIGWYYATYLGMTTGGFNKTKYQLKIVDAGSSDFAINETIIVYADPYAVYKTKNY